jgi:hypothetical protein
MAGSGVRIRASEKTNFYLGERAMATKTTKVLGQKIRRGERMTKNSKWKLTTETGLKRAFTGTLLETFNIGKTRIAIFSVRKLKA